MCVIVPVCVCVLYTSPVGTCVHWNRLSLVLDTYEYTACLKQLIWVRHSGREDQSARVILKGCIQYIHLGNIRKHELMKKKLPGLSPKASKKNTRYLIYYEIPYFLLSCLCYSYTYTNLFTQKWLHRSFFLCVCTSRSDRFRQQKILQPSSTKNEIWAWKIL